MPLSLPPRRLLRLLWPFAALWLALAGALGIYTWRELDSARERQLAAGRIEAENLARALADGVPATAFDRDRLVRLFRTLRLDERSTVGLMDGGRHLYASSYPDGPSRNLAEVADPAGVVASAAVPGTDLVAFAALSEKHVLGQWRRQSRALVAFALLAVIGLSLPIALLARRAAHQGARRQAFDNGTAVELANARFDTLTGAANRRAFDEALALCHDDLVRLRQPFVLAYVDVDRFRRLNAMRGHEVGDRALQRIALTLAASVRRSDMIARVGGDEFAVLMPNADGTAMRRPYDAMFTSLTVAVAGEGWPVSFSIGVIAFEGAAAGPLEASALADKLMHAVKASGRNGVRFAAYRDGRLHPDVGVGSADLDVRI